MNIPGLGFLRRQLRARPLAAFAVAFLIGLIVARRWPVPLAISVGAGAAALAVCAALGLRKRRFAAVMLLFALCAGMARMGLAQRAVPEAETQYSVAMTGRIVSEPFTNPSTGRVISRFRLESVNGEPSALTVRLYLRGEAEALAAVDYGQRLELTGHIWRADPVTNPWEFDFGDYLRRNGMAAYATAKIEDVAILDTQTDAQSAVIRIRRAISARIDALFPRCAGLVRALLLGDRSQLSEELRDALRETGTAHLICISGLHVTVLAAALSLLLGLFMPRRHARLCAIALLIGYGALIGFGTPFVRALAMFAVFSFAPAVGLPSDSITRLAAAMLALLTLRPMDIADAGFVLSFSASAGILLLYPPLERSLRLRPADHRRAGPAYPDLRRRLLAYFPQLLCASLAAQLATLPAVIAFFGVQSLVSLPFNLVCVPLCLLGYLGALAALAISIAWMPLAGIVAAAADALLSALTAVTRWSAALPLTGIRIGRYPAALILLHAAILLAASDLSLVRERLKRVLPSALLLAAALSSLITFARAWEFSVAFLDAGQADCAVVRTRGRTYLIDAGDTYTPAADYLNATCLHLDGVFLSHPHQDHAGGLTAVLTSFRPDAVYVPAGWFDQEDIAPAVLDGVALAQNRGVPIIELIAGDVVGLSADACLTVFSPDAARPPDSVNDLSLLALIACRGQGVLFTGDLSMDGEPALIPDADVLKVAHHGSNKATSQRFLDACTPEIAVISVGENNFGHPGENTLARLADAGAEVLLTRECGAVTLTLRSGEWRIDTYLEASHALE